MNITELKKQMGIGSVLTKSKNLIHPNDDTDMCYVVGRTNPMQYKRVKQLNISDEDIMSVQPYVEWLEQRNAFLEEEARKRYERDHTRLPF